MFQNTKLSFFLANFELVFDFSTQNQLIAVAFLLITAIANLYAISQNRKLESLIGSLYCLSSLICLFSGDFISMIISLEFMTIFACIIIFIGSRSVKHTRQYFLTHLFSSGLILVGMSLLIDKTANVAFTPLTTAIYNSELSAILILAGCLINASIIFFNGWVVNCYPKASSSGMIYLLSFTTKIALITIFKLFSGLETLKFFGLAMIIYGLIFALIEKNLRRLICYLTVSQLGFILTAIGINSPRILYLIPIFIFMHILYNGVFALYFAIIEDSNNIKNYRDLKTTKYNPILLIGFVLTILIYGSILPINSSYIKLELANALNENYIMIFFKIATCTILFGLVFEGVLALLQVSNKEVTRHCERLQGAWQSHFIILRLLRQNLQFFLAMTPVYLLYLSSCLITLVICTFYPVQISGVSNSLSIILIALFLALLLRSSPRILTKNINLDLYRYIQKIIYFCITKYKEAKSDEIEEDEYFNFKAFWQDTLSKISAWHNGQTAIFIIVLILISLILVL
ncbi:proton-conducting transporter membrane subunit [Rickettsia endosymbiont of Seladonia tumulorum]|uniref:proton-conducting transporter transmembrane domain-containing protein n=1 Tax=Rickettsia endosymbiont of Seladonia tumulorum TaxID=3066270 RepID=UPI00313B2D28